MKVSGKIFSIVFMIFILNACKDDRPAMIIDHEPSIIPQPAMMKMDRGDFTVKNNTVIYFEGEDLESSAKYLGEIFARGQHPGLKVNEGSGDGINLKINSEADEALGDEGYRLKITPRNIEIIANNKKGVFYGVQTLVQMLPSDYLNGLPGSGEMRVPCAEIEDMPRFKWRGLLLDVSRHFFTTDEIRKLIDEMAAYKFNILQLHLTDDQGWRIEIKSLPELTSIGSLRVPRTGLWGERQSPEEGEKASYGGFYTHDQIRDLVQYARERNINILPEIEAPGHSLAAIASYPVLSSTGKKYSVNPGSKFYGIDDNSLCAGRESTYEYLDKVFTEVAELFPFEYIHIGGDECFKGFWLKCDSCKKRMRDNNLKDANELQSYLVKRMEKMLEAKGKKLIGWDEILEGGLAPNAAVMSWRGMKGGIEAAKAGHKVVMSPVEYAYIDFYQGDPAIEPPTYAMLRLNKVYTFEPVPEGVDSSLIMGGQGNLWTESVPTFRHAEYMFWPRSLALAEVLWSPARSRNWQDFVARTEDHLKSFSQRDINYSVSFYDAIITPSKDENGNLVIQLDSEIEGLSIYYTFDNTYPDHHSRLYRQGEKLIPDKDADIFRVITYRNGKPLGRMISVPLTDIAKRVGLP